MTSHVDAYTSLTVLAISAGTVSMRRDVDATMAHPNGTLESKKERIEYPYPPPRLDRILELCMITGLHIRLLYENDVHL